LINLIEEGLKFPSTVPHKNQARLGGVGSYAFKSPDKSLKVLTRFEGADAEDNGGRRFGLGMTLEPVFS
jgi:hypothetical protein